MPEKFAKDLLKHAIIPLTGLGEPGALGAIRDIGNSGTNRAPHQLWAEWPNRKSRAINEFQSKQVLKEIVFMFEGLLLETETPL